MKAIILTLLCAFMATQAAALSCMRPDPIATYKQMEAVPEDVYVLRGTLTFDEDLLPGGVLNIQRDPPPIPAMFKGRGLTRAGFTSRFERPVTLQPTCAGPWCGNEAAGQELIAFAKVVGDDVIIESSPCSTTVFYGLTDAMVDALTSCIRGEACEPTQF